MATITQEAIAANRRIAVAALMSNHRGYSQVRHSLGRDGQRCAVGVLAEAFHIPINEMASDVYQKINELLGAEQVTGVSSEQIYGWNDRSYLTFEEIAGKLAKRWKL